MTGGLETLLEDAARLWPRRDAFRIGGRALSYGALLLQSRKLAARLTAAGVGRGDRVAIAMSKGLDMPVAVHAIWMAGAAFVPLDPTAPVARLAQILESCDVAVVVGARRNGEMLAALGRERAFTLVDAESAETPGAAALDAPGDFAPVANGAEDVAYIMFTSGSTGAPKGLVHTHGSGRAFAEMWARLYRLTGDDVFFCTAPLHFDFCLADFLAAPLAGATTELAPEAVQRFPASLARLLEKSRATIWSTVPYALIQICERGALEQRDLGALRVVIFGGEPMPPRQLAAARRLIDARFSNSYGPAEVNQVTEYTAPVDHPTDQPIPLGAPTDHAAFVTDDEGELLVATPAMMRGYWGRPDLDDRAFVFRDGRRFYRTGDLAQRGDDGLWRYAGRADRQVKVRGYRLELDEIEFVLSAHADVSEAVAIVADGGTTIKACVTLGPGARVTEAELKSHAAGRLPPYAVPAAIDVVSRFPRTGTGKIDRRVLSEILA